MAKISRLAERDYDKPALNEAGPSLGPEGADRNCKVKWLKSEWL